MNVSNYVSVCPVCRSYMYFNFVHCSKITFLINFQLYTSEDNRGADHVDFKKALDLLDFLPTSGASASDLEEEKENLRLKIWARSVLRNPWSTLETGDPIAVIAETVFFRLVRFTK